MAIGALVGLGKLATGAGVAGLGVGLPLAQLGMFGQNAEDTVKRDSLIYDPDVEGSKKIGDRKAGAAIADFFTGRSYQDLVDASLKSRAKQIKTTYKDLLDLNTKLKPAQLALKTDRELRSMQKKAVNRDAALTTYGGSGGDLTPEQLEGMTTQQINNAARRASNKRDIEEALAIERAKFDNPQTKYDRDRQESKDLLAQQLQAFQFEDARAERRMANRKQDLIEQQTRLQNSRADRKDQQLALMTLIKGLAEMSNSVI